MIGLHVYISLQIQKVDITCMRHQDRCSSKTKSNMFLYCFCKSSTDKGYTNVPTSKQDSCIYIFNPICMLFFFLQKTDAHLEQVEHCIESVCKEEEVFTFLKADGTLLSVPLYIIQDMFPGIEVQDLEISLLALCSPTFTLHATYRGSDLLSINL